MLAIIEAYKAGLFKKQYWQSNIIAGIIVGIVALPLAMAFAVASGYKPEQGLYTAIMAGLIVSIFGGSRVQVAGPTGAFVVILASISARYGIDGLTIATIMAGILLVIMGLLKIGNAIKFIPYPVIVGFTSGIGVIIFVGAIKDFFGLPIKPPLDATFYEKISLIDHNFSHFNIATTMLALASLACIIIAPKIFAKLPGALAAMVLATGIQMFIQSPDIATIGTIFGALPQSLPAFTIPRISLDTLLLLLGPAFTIALLGAIESLLSAAAADAITGTRHNSNQELLGQGFANIIAPFWGGFASTGAIARTVTNIRNGGNSPLAAIIHSIVLILIILIFAPLAVHIPFCALAAILFVVAYTMSDIPEFLHIARHAPWYDLIVLITTFLLTIFTDLVIAVAVGVILALLLIIIRFHLSVRAGKTTKGFKETLMAQKISSKMADDIMIYTIDGPFFFGVAEQVEHALAITHTDPKAIIFDFTQVPFIDMTGMETLSKVMEQYHKRGIKVYFCQANKTVTRKLKNAGVIDKNDLIFPSLESALKQHKEKKSVL